MVKKRILMSSVLIFTLPFLMQTSHAQVISQDSLALVAIYDSTNGAGWTENTNWLSDSNVSSWYGITVVDDRVTQIDLGNNNLVGTIPSEIGNLTALSILSMGNNTLSGPIPPEIENCTSLYAIQIFNTDLNGSLPPEIGNLDNLNTIQLYNNQLEGSIPTEIGDLDNIVWIELYNNNLTGSIPAEIGNLTGLIILDLERNELSGPIPHEIGNLTGLQGLSLAGNLLDGSIPAEFGYLTNLTALSLWSNQLSGPIPAEIGDMVNLTGISLSNNQLTGSIPAEIGDLTELTSLNMADNQLSGNIPETLGNLTNLSSIYLQSNQLSGPIPDSLGNLTNLVFLNLSDNQLENEIPDIFDSLSVLSRLQLNRNLLTGAVPPSVTSLVSLTQLAVNNNRLTDLPDLSALENILWLLVEQNALTFEDIEPNISVAAWGFTYAPQDSVGMPVDTSVESGSTLVLVTEVGGSFNVYQWYKNYIPIDGASDSTVTISPVALSDSGTYTCHITNTLATELTLFHHPFTVNVYQSPSAADSLALVDLYTSTNGDAWNTRTNWLTAESLENWYGVTVENNRVVALDLQENNLSGSVPASLGDLTGLTFLSLRNNNLTGSLPDEIGNLTAMRDLDFAFNNLTGEIPETIGNLSGLGALFLDFNALEGNIPLSLGNLQNLAAIYLGGNNLEGSFPDTLCTLFNLTVFSLQSNNLSGPLPAGLVNLSHLESIDLENNHLTDFPDISDNIPPLQQLHIANNAFMFGDIEPYINAGLVSLTYADQDSVGSAMDTTITEEDDLILTVMVSGSANTYQWKKDGVDIVGAQSSVLTLSSVGISDAGSYHCEVTSSVVQGLTLSSRPVTVTVEEALNIAENIPGIPDEYLLYQNYPNPFNPVTIIRYALPVACHVNITVHNVLGQQLITLISENQRAGNHSIRFNGLELSSGVYFYKISTEGFMQVNKMILMR